MLTRRLIRSGCLALLIVLGMGRVWAEDSLLVEQVEELLPRHVGAAVMAVDEGKVIFKHAWGNRRFDETEPCTTSTNFRLASVSKQFTATAILLLVDQKVVELDDTIDRFFPECPDYWHNITVHHLLSHTSGLPDYENLIPEGTTLQLMDLNVLELLRATEKPLFEPGAKFAYSNSGYALLGLIVEAAADCRFQDFLRTEVFKPLGMNRSLLYVAGMNRVPERAFGHELDSEKNWIVGDQSLTSAVRGDGGVYSSLDDLELWITDLDQEHLLSDSSYTKMFTPQVRSDRGQQDYGYGWFLDTYRGERRTMHAGETRGFSLMLQRFPNRQAAVVILLNRSALDPPGDYVDQIVDCLLFDRDD
ncbi:serine hydrolase domain-containing protein [Bythopirellula goksoeyrii]|uniref:Penicillin-binding protein 4 n=1 Tax=Bythopirellula goksoeyrii TaxID=1400387 RepID=A0A5B9Q8S6_9BACT|nr:serine hydrolase domain-containing protein [Bythopirellula goksoeyrii]QEG33945.1 Penicillin-binding protein 4* [Bythopirellula goksoeyrii]